MTKIKFKLLKVEAWDFTDIEIRDGIHEVDMARSIDYVIDLVNGLPPSFWFKRLEITITIHNDSVELYSFEAHHFDV